MHSDSQRVQQDMTEIYDRVHYGHCLCRKVEYTVIGDPIVVAHCHCDDCQRLTGSGHSTGAMYNSSDLEPGVVVFARNRKPWDAIDESMPTFDAQPSFNPGDAQKA